MRLPLINRADFVELGGWLLLVLVKCLIILAVILSAARFVLSGWIRQLLYSHPSRS